MDLLVVRDLHGVSISPDGTYVAFVVGQALYETNSYRSALFVVGTEAGSAPLSLGSAGPPHWNDGTWDDEPPQWSPDSRYITYRMETSGTWQVWRWSREGGEPSRLTYFQGDVKSYQWTPDGNKLVLTVNKFGESVEARRLSERGILYDGTLSAWNGVPLVDQLVARNSSATEIWIHDLVTDQERKVTEEETRSELWVSDLDEKVFRPGDSLQGHHIVDPKISPDGRTVVYKRYFNDPAIFDKNAFVLFSKPVRGGTPTKLTAGIAYIGQYWWNWDSKQLYYTENSGDGRPSRLMVVDAVGGTPRRVFNGTDWLQGYSVDQRGRYTACTRQTNTVPPQIALLDLTNGAVRTLVDVNPEFKNFKLSEAIRIEGTNKYGDQWFAHLVKPLGYQAGKQYPLVITTYLSGDNRFLRGGSGDEYPIQVFAANGFVVLNFDVGVDRNFRSGDFQSALLQWASPVASMEMAVRGLSEKGIVDPKKVAITGFSHGAEMVEYAISHTSFVHAAIESGGGTRDPYFYYMADTVWHGIFSDWGLGGWPEGTSKANWQVLSPVSNANHVEAPLLSNSPDSEFIPGLSLLTSLQELRKPVEMFVYAGEFHSKNQPKHRYEIYERNLDWLNYWLRDLEDPIPAKGQQYLRWRELRKLQEANQAQQSRQTEPAPPHR